MMAHRHFEEKKAAEAEAKAKARQVKEGEDIVVNASKPEEKKPSKTRK